MQINLPFDIGDDLWWVSDETKEVCCDEGGIYGVAIRKDGIFLIDRCKELSELHSQYGCLTREEAEAYREKMLKEDMKMEVGITWGVIFGKGDSTDVFYDTVELTEEEMQLYKQALKDEISPNDVDGLRGAWRRAYDRIEAEQIQIGIEEGFEYVLECQARGESPYDHGWTLSVEFDDEVTLEDLEEE